MGPIIHKRLEKVEPGSEAARWYVIALTRLGDSSVLKDLLMQSVESPDHEVRETSIYAIYDGKLCVPGNREAVLQYLPKWLEDPYSLTAGGGSCPGLDKPGTLLYPVRSAARTIQFCLGLLKK
jgi:hypothetical protein